MNVARRLAVLTIVLAFVTTAACSGNDGGDDTATPGLDSREVLATLADGYVASYERLVDSLDALGERIDSLCSAPDDAGLEAARAAWRETTTAWQDSRLGGFGPAMEARLMSDVAFAARAGAVDDLLAGTEPLDPDSVADQGASVRGIFAVEHLLFGPPSHAMTAGGEAAERPCGLAAADTTLATEAVRSVLAEWTGGYRDEVAEGLGGDPTASIDEITNQAIACITAVDVKGLRDLADAATLDKVPVTRLDGEGDHLMAQHRALLDATARVLVGDPEAAGDALVDLVEQRSVPTADDLTAATAAAVEAMSALPDSAEASFAEAEALDDAATAVAELRVLLSTEVASQLGVTVRFSDADGDS